MSTFSIGQRVVDKDGFRGTVQYVGPVATSKTADAVYAGVEWDAPGRGKNDGAVVVADGSSVRYFTCTAGQGSFMKLDLLSGGVSILEALDER
jgi:dynactin complex subunit